MPTSTVPPPPGAVAPDKPQRPDMVPLLLQTNEDLRVTRYNLARACEDLEAARAESHVRPWRKTVRR